LANAPASAATIEAKENLVRAQSCKSGLCRLVVFDLSATATDTLTGASTSIHQGYQVITSTDACQDICGSIQSCN
jgi:hypothetical protein